MVTRRIAEVQIDVTNSRSAQTKITRIEDSIEGIARAASNIKIQPELDKQSLDAALSKIEAAKAEIKVDAKVQAQAAKATVKELQSQIKEIEADLDLDDGDARAKIRSLEEVARDISIQAEIDTSKARADIRGLNAEAKDLKVGVEADTSKAKSQIKEIGNDAEEISVGVSLDESTLAGFGQSLTGALAASGALAGGAAIGLGVAIAAGVVGAFSTGLELEAGQDLLAAQLALSPAEAEKLGSAAANVYAGAWGESLEEVNATISDIGESGLLDFETDSQQAFEGAAQSALDLAKVLDEDVSSVVRTADQLVTNGLAPNAEAAFDQIAAASQNGSNQTGELLEVLTEYAPSFAEAGFSAEQALSVIAQGADSGAFKLDNLGDLIKESGIKLTELDDRKLKLVAENTELAADEVAKLAENAKNGDNISFLNLIKSIQGIEDGTKRSQVAVELLGTPFEDLSNSAFLDVDFGGRLEGVEGSAANLSETLNDNLKTKLESLKREGFLAAAQALEDFLIPAVEYLIPIIQDTLGPAVSEITGGLKAFVGAFKDALGGNEDVTSSGFAGFMERLANTIVLDVLPAVQSFNDFIQATLGPVISEAAGGLKAFVAAFEAALGGDEDVTSSGFAGFMEGLANTIVFDVIPAVETFAEFIGTDVVPVLQQFGVFLTEEVLPVVQQFGAFLGDDVLPIIQQWAAVLFDDVIPAVLDFGTILVENVVTVLTELVLPTLEGLYESFTENIVPAVQDDVIPAMEDFISILEVVWENVEVGIDLFEKHLQPAFEEIVKVVGAVVVPIFELLFDVIGKVFGGIIDIIAGSIATMAGILTGDTQKAIDGFKKTFGGIVGIVTAPLESMLSLVKTRLGQLGGTFRSAFDGVSSAVESALSPIQRLIDLIGRIPSSVPNPFSNFSVPSLPFIDNNAYGGITNKPTLSWLSEFGHEEAILPTASPISHIKTILGQADNDVLGRLYADYEARKTVNNTSYGGNTNVSVTVQETTRRSIGERRLHANLQANAIARRLGR